MTFEAGPRSDAGRTGVSGRWGLALVAMVAAALLLVMMVLALGVRPPDFDLLLHRVVHGRQSGVLTAVARRVTDVGSSPVLYPLTFVVGWLLGTEHGGRRLRDALVTPLLLAAGSVARFGLSLAVGRSRPAPQDWLYQASGFAFPSGHTSNTTMAAGLLMLLFCQHRRPGRGGLVVAWCVALLASAGVGLSRVYLGVHWASDVVGGWAFGVTWVALVALIGRRFAAGGARRAT